MARKLARRPFGRGARGAGVAVFHPDSQPLNDQLSAARDVMPEDSIGIRCVFDNSRHHQPRVDGRPREPRDVRWGENTYDEMCLGLLYVTPR